MIDLEIKEKKDCMGCYACFNICPKNCISMETDDEGFWYPKVDYDECIECNKCVKVCPILYKNEVENNLLAYACYNEDEEVRLKSSSGGIFTLVAEEILKNEGLVFGAGFDKEFNIVHTYIETKEEVNRFRGSKYVQSSIDDNFNKVKYFLNEGKEVLFTGTPCQIGGLKSYLGKEYENLFTMDNICHGVPSPKVWKEYIEFRENRAKSSTRQISFRDKKEGWKKYSLSFSFQDSLEYRSTHREDAFMKAFLRDICLRPSCYDCHFKTLHRESDLTMADFWGINEIYPDFDDDKGTSLIFVNSQKGKVMFDIIKKHMIYKVADIHQAVSYNSAAIQSVKYNPKREDFLKELGSLDFDKLVKKYCNTSIPIRIKRKIISILKKLGD